MDIFGYVDEVVEHYEGIEHQYKELAALLKQILEDIVVANSKYTLSVSSRIKDAESLREKLIRNSYYRIHTTKEEIVANVQDIIGLRIECKFTEDEVYVFSLIEQLFDRTDDQIYFYHKDYPKMRLKLNEQQPVKQRNGFDIYKIDGRYEDKNGDFEDDIRINFEVQIKSMVNMFWGDIEHKIIYKNPSYFMVEQPVMESMVSIRENLNLVDQQLHKLYKRYKREDVSRLSFRKDNIGGILSKLIHDTFAKKMKNELGFVVQFKDTCDSIVEYIFVVNNAAQMEDYGRVMMETFYLTSNIAKDDMSFRKPITLEHELNIGDPFIDTTGVTIQKQMNVDFNWHLYLVILFEMEQGKKVDSLETYLRYYKGKITANAEMSRLEEIFPEELALKIRNDLLAEMGYVFRRHVDIKLLYESGIDALSYALHKTVTNIIKDTPDWNKEKSIYFLYLNNSVNLD